MTRQLMPLAFLLLATGCVGAKKYDAMEAAYAQSLEDNAALQRRIDATQDANASLDAKADRLADEKDRLEATNEELDRALRNLRSREATAEARVAAYRDLIARFADLIDAGTLSVKVVDGRMVVELPTDILFPSGSAQLSPEGQTQLEAVGEVLAGIDRSYQIEGHTDTDPIHTPQFPSNWELASARATTVLRVLNEAGVPTDHLSTAGFADTRPVATNETKDGKMKNRRIEIALLPDLSLLPGAEQLEALAQDATADARD